jgi:hypothetical protein
VTDLTFTRSGELDVTQIEGNSEAGIEFVDIWMQPEMIVADAGRIIVRDLEAIEAAAKREGLTIEHDLIVTEKASS